MSTCFWRSYSIWKLDSFNDYRYYATVDDAAGEAFDKGARILGLKYPGGPENRESFYRWRF